MKKILKQIRENKELYLSLVRNDLHSRYNGSAFGTMWGIVQPVVTVMVYWFVFQVGLRSGARLDRTPYILWLICGIIPWFYFSEALGAVTNSFIEYAYLVKKVQFRVGIIPLIKIGSSWIIHMIFVILTMIILNIYGYTLNVFYLQQLYYMGALIFLLAGLGMLLSSITVFFRDMAQIVGIMIQVGFWITPIVWGSEVLPPAIKTILMLNPICYIVEGYRESLLSGVFFLNHPIQTLYYWSVSILIFAAGIKTFHRLKGEFADVL